MLQAPAPDIIEAGRVLATLDDWRAITFSLMFLLVVAVMERIWYARVIRQERQDMAQERERMWEVSEKFGDAAATLGERTNNVVTELQVQRALNARLEGVVASLESEVSRLSERIK